MAGRPGAGAQDVLVALDMPTETDDGYGGFIEGWAEQFQTWARFVFSRGDEAMQAAHLQGSAVLKLRLKNNPNTRRITATWRLRSVVAGEEYNIRSIDAVTDRTWLYAVVERGVAV